MRTALFVAGPKGVHFLRNLNTDVTIDLVVSYPTKGLQQDAYAEIREICSAKGYQLYHRTEVRPECYVSAELVFLIGWQWLSADVDQRFIVFHDSLLPKFRGFNPTVSALIAGETELGVTAFSPVGGEDSIADSGPIFGQEMIRIQYPTTIRAVYEQLGFAYCRLADRVVSSASLGPLSFSQQDSHTATYSIWRNEDDYRIDWAMPAEEICRFVDAVGWPYMGAKTSMQGREIRIDRVEICSDLVFAQRCPGKIWTLNGGSPEVVCGSGMLRVVKAREQDGGLVKFTSLRNRLA
jgi:methionyl-tRNA formyltransferase